MGASCVRALLTETGKRKEEWWQPFFHLLPPSFHSFSPRMGRRTPAHTPPLRSTCTPPRAASRRGTGTPPNNSHRSTSEIGTVDHRSDDGRRRLRRQVGRSYSYMGRRRRRRGRQRRGGRGGHHPAQRSCPAGSSHSTDGWGQFGHLAVIREKKICACAEREKGTGAWSVRVRTMLAKIWAWDPRCPPRGQSCHFFCSDPWETRDQSD
jgi:hypothetical protein